MKNIQAKYNNSAAKVIPNASREKNRLKKVVIILITIIFMLVIGFLAVIPSLIMNDMVNLHVDFKQTYSLEDFEISSEKLMLRTSDNINIVAHEVYTPNPKGVVIFISGIHNPSVTAFFGHSAMLQENGYASILYEMRSHGESEGDLICLGYKEYMDTQAVVDYIKSNEKYKEVPIIVFGVSMGGATAINSIGEIDDINGLISLSSYSSWEDVFCDNMALQAPELLAKAEKPFIKMYTTYKYGLRSYNITPKKEIKKIGKRPALIMHSKGDSQVPFASFERIMENAPDHVETWVREGDLHFILEDDDFLNPKNDMEYSNHIIDFLDKNFAR